MIIVWIYSSLNSSSLTKNDNPDPLHCGKHANKTDYDHLAGIAERWKHPDMPEPEVALIFKRAESDHVDMKELEKSLREAIKAVSIYVIIENIHEAWKL